MAVIKPVKGTRDFYPEEMAFQAWLNAAIRDVSESFGYQEFNSPILETLELYAAKSGEELVKEQAFVFPDRNDELLTLRPELTPSLARMVAARSKSLPMPLRWWSYGPFWRYERPQRGRSREFFQWNIDMIGLRSPEADAEIAAVAAEFFRRVGLDPSKVRILVNNRQLVESRLGGILTNEVDRQSVFRLIDRRDRMPGTEWAAYAVDTVGLSSGGVDALTVLLEDREAWQDFQELVDFFDALDALGVRDYFDFEPQIIRGLDYYTGTVFEARDAIGRDRAILGGGRYDDLIADVGGESVPAVGFAMGDVVLELVLETAGVKPSLKPNPADALVANFDVATRSETLQLAADLRRAGIRVEWYPRPDRLSKQFKYADRQGIPVVIILGPDELESGRVSVKLLESGEQQDFTLDTLVEAIKPMIRPDQNSKTGAKA